MAPPVADGVLDSQVIEPPAAERIPGPMPGPATEPLPEHDTDPEPVEPPHEHEDGEEPTPATEGRAGV